MIASFADRALETFYYAGSGPGSRRIPANIHGALRRKLDMLQNAVSLTDLRVPPGNRLEQLKGHRMGQFSIRVNDQWRVLFRWRGGTAHDVALADYH